jgi:hypothetical protein
MVGRFWRVLRTCYPFDQLFFGENRLFIFEPQKSNPVSFAEVGAPHLNQVHRQADIGAKWRDGAPHMSPFWYLREKIAS